MNTKHFYGSMTADELEELFSNFLTDSWSFSKISSFARNEKAFEMNYIYNEKSKRSASSIAGNAYHAALDSYFENKRLGKQLDLVDLERIAFDYIEEINANDWKLQKTTPTVEKCKEKALKVSSALLKNFFSELSTYEDDIKEIIGVEMYCDEFLVINGVDIPLPCHSRIDLVIRTKSNKVAVIDHKSKTSFTDEKELKLTIGQQAMTYVKCYEAKTNIKVDEVWFVENKSSKNKDGSSQLNCFKLELDSSVRKLYEALIYEPLKRMLEAVSDPDYVYVINHNDNFIDKAELYEFWAKTMLAEVEDFNIPESKKELVASRLKKIRDASIATVNPKVIKNFKENANNFIQYDLTNKDMTNQEKIEHVLRTFSIIVNVAHVFDGYSSNTYLLEVSAGVKISSIYNHRLDLANALNVPNVRIQTELYVYEGKSYIALESAKKRDKDLIFNKKYLKGKKIPIGMDNLNQPVVWDLENHSTPHALICGATGSGKSVCINSIIEFAILSGVKTIDILDPKYEFTKFKKSKNVNVFQDIESIEKRVNELVKEMNERIESGDDGSDKSLVILDEFADAFLMARKGKQLDVREMVEVGVYKQTLEEQLKGLKPQPKMAEKVTGQEASLQENLQYLLQKGRSTGYRLVLATQRASAKIISGDLKVNLPVQICFRVPKEVDSKVVIDEVGAESLAGMGDGLINSPEYLDIIRFQAFYKPD